MFNTFNVVAALLLFFSLTFSQYVSGADADETATDVTRPAVEHYFVKVYYCDNLAGFIWHGPDAPPGVVKLEAAMRDRNLQRVVTEAYERARNDGNVIRQDEPPDVKCPGDGTETGA